MTRLQIAAALALAGLAPVAILAAPQGPSPCPAPEGCEEAVSQDAAPREAVNEVHNAIHPQSGPHIGEQAHDSQAFAPAAQDQLRAAPQGHEYRVIGNHVVLVETESQTVSKLIGVLTSAAQ